MNLFRAASLLAASALAVALTPTGSHAAQGNDAKSDRGAQTQHNATDVFVDTVPCASDTGYFEITLTYNSVERFTDSRGHFTQTGTFSAAPVTPTEFIEEIHDDHTHLIVLDSEPREGATYSGRVTSSGTMNSNSNASTETFNFRIKGTSSDGERVVAHALFHQTTSNGETRSLIERETCQ